MKKPTYVGGVRKISAPKKGAGEVTMAKSHACGGKNKGK